MTKKTGIFRWKAQERYIGELLNPNDDSGPEDIINYRVEIHQRIAYPTFSLVLALIAISFSLKGQFSRRGNYSNNIMAIVTSIAFIISVMAIYNLIGKSINFAPLLYADIAAFIAFATYILKSNYRKT